MKEDTPNQHPTNKNAMLWKSIATILFVILLAFLVFAAGAFIQYQYTFFNFDMIVKNQNIEDNGSERVVEDEDVDIPSDINVNEDEIDQPEIKEEEIIPDSTDSYVSINENN